MERAKRRSLAVIRDSIMREMVRIQDVRNFDLDNGTAQLTEGEPNSIARAVDYGRYDALRDLLDDLS